MLGVDPARHDRRLHGVRPVRRVLVPLTLRVACTDCTASSIFLTTGTDIAGMGLMLALATVLVPLQGGAWPQDAESDASLRWRAGSRLYSSRASRVRREAEPARTSPTFLLAISRSTIFAEIALFASLSLTLALPASVISSLDPVLRLHDLVLERSPNCCLARGGQRPGAWRRPQQPPRSSRRQRRVPDVFRHRSSTSRIRSSVLARRFDRIWHLLFPFFEKVFAFSSSSANVFHLLVDRICNSVVCVCHFFRRKKQRTACDVGFGEWPVRVIDPPRSPARLSVATGSPRDCISIVPVR